MNDTWTQIVTEWPFIQPLADAICVIVPLACLLAYAGIFFLSATARILSVSRQRSTFNKCSKQLAFFGLLLGWIILAGSRVWLYYTAPDHPEGSFESYILEISWMMLSLGVLLSTIYYFLWRILKNMPVLHVTIGMISAVQNCLALAGVLCVIRISAAIAHPEAQKLSLPDLIPNVWNAPLWSACAYTVPLLFAMPAAFGACWLVIRRNRDDFGRDYYNTMIAWCSSWAKNAWSILLLLLIAATSMRVWENLNNSLFNEQDAIYETSALLLWLVPELCWFIVQKSKIPLRNSWLLFIALIIAIIFMLPYFMDITLI